MPESAAQIHARARVAAARGRLATPPLAEQATFPWEVVGGAIVAKTLAPPGAESPREGEEGGGPCRRCAGLLPERVVWEDEHWILSTDPAPRGLPLVLKLWTREHLDYGDLDDDLASEFGRISNRLTRIVQGLGNVGRVHTGRWGDTCSHFHVWFFARPAGFAQIRGSLAAAWDEILPPVEDEVWRADLRAVATKLANWGGHARA